MQVRKAFPMGHIGFRFPFRSPFRSGALRVCIAPYKGYFEPCLEYSGLCCSPRDFQWAPSMGPWLLQRDLKYGPLLCRWFIMGLFGF